MHRPTSGAGPVAFPTRFVLAMRNDTAFGLGVLQWRALRALWSRGSLTAKELATILHRHKNTMRTTLNRLCTKGMAKQIVCPSTKTGRSFRHRYEPSFTEEEWRKSLASQAVKAVIESVGYQAMPSFIVESLAQRDPQLLTELEAAIHEKRRR